MAQTAYILAVVISTIVSTEASTDPCTNYVNLNDPERSTAYARGTTAICDSTIAEQWYRPVSGAGSDMPTTAVPVGRCGTQYPVWAQDPLPLANQEKDVTVCVAHIFGNCHDSFQIKVKNCVNYNVYYLKQTSGCPVAYCFGTQLQCPAGQSSATGFTPDCENVPTIPLSPSVTAGLEDGHAASSTVIHKSIKFDCNMGSTPANNTHLLFEVRWYIEDNEIAVFENVTYQELVNTSLSESKWKDHYTMGFNVKCTMRAKYSTSAIYGTAYDSAFFYAGFKASETELTVLEGQEKIIDIWLTVPLGCAALASDTSICFLTIRVREPEYQQKTCKNGVTGGGIAFKNIKCGVKFDYISWNVKQQISITGEKDSLYNSNNRMTYMRLKAEKNLADPGWSYATIPDIKVHVVDQDIQTLNKKCISSNDPHMTTFDNRRYENQRAGEFTMFKHSKYPIEVNAMYTKCPGYWWTHNRATCNCGVVVRNDDALFIANFCGKITTGTDNNNAVSSLPSNRYIEKVACDDTYMTVVNDGSKYTITLPTGTVIVFSYGNVKVGTDTEYGIHYIHIKPSVEDIKSSTGLCGYFDGDSSNDFRLRDGTTTQNVNSFAENWRVSQADSLFAPGLNLNPADVNLRQYCTCRVDASDSFMINSSQIKCELQSAMETCISTEISANDAKGFFTRCGEGRSRRSVGTHNSHVISKRSTDSEDGIEKIDLIYSPDYTNQPTEPEWSNGWDESKARSYCSQHIEQNSMFALCNNSIPDYDSDISSTVDDCVNDIKMTGNTQFLEASIESLKTTCLQEATRLENLTKSASSSGNSSKSLLDDILDISCYNNCSGNGTCIGGKCTCFTGYEGAHCGLQKSVPPTVSTKSNSGKCKTDRAACTTYGITGEGFISGSIKCKARHFQIYGDGRTELTGSILSFSGTYINEISCSCTIPGSRRRRAASPATVIADGYYMSVSNDGTTFSEEITFINYDSACYECNVTAVSCTELSSCNGTTTVSSTASTTASETTTITSAVTTKNTSPDNRRDKEKRDEEDQSNVGMIIAVVICVMALILLGTVVVIFLLKKKFWKQKNCTADSSTDARADKNARTRFENNSYEHLDNSRANSAASLQNHTYEQFSSRTSSTTNLVKNTNNRPDSARSVTIGFPNPSYEERAHTPDLFGHVKN